MKCEKCGSENDNDSKFCRSCGERLAVNSKSKNMILALVISFILVGLGIAYAGNRKKGIIIFIVGIIFNILGRASSVFAIIGVLIWAYGMYYTYNEVRIANGYSNPNLIEDWKGWSTDNKVLAGIIILIVLLVVVSTVVGAFAPKTNTSHEIDSSTSSNSNYSSISSDSSGSDRYSSSSSNGHDVSSHYEGKEGSSDTYGTVYDDGSVESHQTGHTRYGDYQIDSYMDSDGNVHGKVVTGGRTYNV